MKTISISPKEMAAATAPEDRFVFVKLGFAERPNEGAHSSQASLQQILRVAVRIIVADLQGEPGSFIVTENPVELIDPDGKETKRKGYLGIPLQWTGAKWPPRNWKSAKWVLLPKCCAHPHETKPVAGDAVPEGKHGNGMAAIFVPVPVASIRWLGKKTGKLTGPQALALGHLAAASIEDGYKDSCTWGSLTSGFYGPANCLRIDGTIDERFNPQEFDSSDKLIFV